MKRKLLSLLLAIMAMCGTISPLAMHAEDDFDKTAIELAELAEAEPSDIEVEAQADWTLVSSNSNDHGLITNYFTRSGFDFKVESGSGSRNDLSEKHLITNLTTGKTYTYSFLNGSGGTSELLVLVDGMSSWSSSLRVRETYIKADADGREYLKRVLGDSSFEATIITEVTANGEIRHHLSVENTSGTVQNNVNFMAMVDTMLNNNDRIPIYANGTNGTYITTEDDNFTLYAEALNGVDEMYAGRWNRKSESDFTAQTEVFSTFGRAEDELLVTDVDSAIYFRTGAVNLNPGETVEMAYQERVFLDGEAIIPSNSVVVAVVDENISELMDSEVITSTVGTTGVITRDEYYLVDNMEYVFDSVTGGTATVSGGQVTIPYTIDYTRQDIVLHYKRIVRPAQPITVYYVDETGAELATADVLNGNVGETYRSTAKTIDGYSVKETPANATGTFSMTAQTVTYVYKKIAAPVTVIHVDADNTHLIEAKILTGHIGETYTSAAQEIAGYTLKSAPQNAAGDFTHEEQTVVYVYEAAAALPATGETNLFAASLTILIASSGLFLLINKKRKLHK